MPSVEEKIALCTSALEKIYNTLIGKMSNVVDKLTKIAAETELLGKIQNQIEENNKQSQNLTQLVTSLNMRLDAIENKNNGKKV